ncbi:Por secretion system C-terminal sorting domain-containing protein [Saccharicrinis carchari]|uniref:Por secretion system C-terminal sorting domain-containing protein n=1 Tax=Saccharicrinis carchari TaxID=1168039 RepID=A0A521B3T9_SACCC|nr:phosphodiester glycosidase family protein [Saccharicrinis carchari]SMO41716.1 Por secretion system C-terminal sorting domain-containing protein [Saccharicrinis carchari]
MKHILLFILSLFFVFQIGTTQDSLFFLGAKQRVDTVIFKHDVGLGSMYTSYRFPDVPLNVHVTEIDLSNPYLKVLSNLSHDSLRNLEAPSKMAIRKTRPGHRVVAAINGDFYTTSGLDIGLPVNGHATNGQLAKKPHTSRSVVAFDFDKHPFINVLAYQGNLKYKGQDIPIDNVNAARGTNQLILFNQFNGSTTKTNNYGTEVVLELKNGSWAINDRVTLTVKEIIVGKGSNTLMPGEAILSGHGTAKALLDGMSVGETLEIDIDLSIKGGGTLPPIKNMIGGNRQILIDGTINPDDWPQLHPRTSLGYSADKNTLYLIMVEGRSAESMGVTTKQLAELQLLSGAANAINLDGGGSSSMVVHNQVANVSSDGSERRVANALLFISEAPLAPAADFSLNAHYVRVPFGNKYQLNASTYNQYGDVVDYRNASGITYQVEGAIGSVDANGLFTATGSGSGKIIAQWQGKTETVWVKVLPASGLSFSLDNLTIDHLNEYKFEVYGADKDGVKYLVSNDLLMFESLDPGIGTVDANGVFRGLQDGVVSIRVATQDQSFEDFCTVHVEVGRGHIMIDDFSDPSLWTVTSSWLNDVTLSRVMHETLGEEMLEVAYTMTYARRTAYINLSRRMQLYGMPDSLLLEATGNGYKASFIMSLDHPAGISSIPSFVGSDKQVFKSPIRVGDIQQVDYPLFFKDLRLTVEKDPAYVKGETYQSAFYLKALKVTYPEADPGTAIPTVNKSQPYLIYPNPIRDGVYIAGVKDMGLVNLNVYKISGQLVLTRQIHFGNNSAPAYINLNMLHKGMYMYSILGKHGKINGKLLKK